MGTVSVGLQLVPGTLHSLNKTPVCCCDEPPVKVKSKIHLDIGGAMTQVQTWSQACQVVKERHFPDRSDMLLKHDACTPGIDTGSWLLASAHVLSLVI